jgi:hypothetical protein
VVDIRTRDGSDFSAYRPLASIRQRLAVYLATLGWQAEGVRFVVGGAKSDIEANTSRQYRLFRVRDEVAKAKARTCHA